MANIECSICLENGADFKLPNCMHKFHNECIARWQRHTCPNCRASIKKQEDFLTNIPNIRTIAIATAQAEAAARARAEAQAVAAEAAAAILRTPVAPRARIYNNSQF